MVWLTALNRFFFSTVFLFWRAPVLSSWEECFEALCVQGDTGSALPSVTCVAWQFTRDPALSWAASLTDWGAAPNWIRQEFALALILFNIFIKGLKDGIRIEAH